MNSDNILEFYLLVRIFVLLYGALVVVYEIQDIANSNFPFDTIKLAIGILMIIFALIPRLTQMIFKKKTNKN